MSKRALNRLHSVRRLSILIRERRKECTGKDLVTCAMAIGYVEGLITQERADQLYELLGNISDQWYAGANYGDMCTEGMYEWSRDWYRAWLSFGVNTGELCAELQDQLGGKSGV